MKTMLKISSFFAIIAGIILIIGGVWGICFTYKTIASEQIVTPADASIPNTPVRGPFTLKSQADIIRHHMLQTTGGKTFAQMPRQIESVDEAGKPILDKTGKPVMVANKSRELWVTASSLTTALNLGILTYAFSAFTILMGLISVWTGIVFHKLGANTKSKR